MMDSLHPLGPHDPRLLPLAEKKFTCSVGSRGESISQSRGDLPLSGNNFQYVPPAASRTSSVAPTEFYSDVAQAFRRAQAQFGDHLDYDFWNRMRQHNLVLWLDYTEEATSYHTLDISMWGAVKYRCTFSADSCNIVQSVAIGHKVSPSAWQTPIPTHSEQGFFTEFWCDPQALELNCSLALRQLR